MDGELLMVEGQQPKHGISDFLDLSLSGSSGPSATATQDDDDITLAEGRTARTTGGQSCTQGGTQVLLNKRTWPGLDSWMGR
jgi:hypothetical protein